MAFTGKFVYIYVYIYIYIFSGNMLEANCYVPKKDSREYFIISTIIISVLSRGLVKSVTELFVKIINSNETVNLCHREIRLCCGKVPGSAYIIDNIL